MRRDRARLTPTALVYSVVGLAALSGLWPAISGLIGASGVAPDVGLALNTMLPLAALVLLSVLHAEATS